MSYATPPGWYPDTGAPGFERWWDGTAWTAHTRPLAAAHAAPEQPPAPAVFGPPSLPLPHQRGPNDGSGGGSRTKVLAITLSGVLVLGARFGLEKELSTAVSKVMLSAKVTVAGMEHVLDVRGEVRRVFGKDEKAAGGFPFTYGISFIELAPTQRLLLLALCHELQTGSVYGG